MNAPPHTPQPTSTLPVRAAAKRLNYAPDYVARLCREGRLDCVQIGAAWYVRKDSLAAFKITRASEKAGRALKLSQFRRQQLNPLEGPSLTRPASAFLPTMLLVFSILAWMIFSILFAFPILR